MELEALSRKMEVSPHFGGWGERESETDREHERVAGASLIGTI